MTSVTSRRAQQLVTSLVAALTLIVSGAVTAPAYATDTHSVSGQVVGIPYPSQVLVTLIEVEIADDVLQSYKDVGSPVAPDGDGTFTLLGMVPGKRYTIKASGPDIRTAYFAAPGSVEGITEAHSWPGDDNVTGKDLQVVAGHTVEVSFELVSGGVKPDAGLLRMARWSAEDSIWGPVDSQRFSGGATSVTFTKVLPGHYAFLVEWERTSDYPSQLAGGLDYSAALDHPSVLHIAADSPTEILFETSFHRSVRVTGQILGAGSSDLLIVPSQDGHPLTPRPVTGSTIDLDLLPGTYGFTVHEADDDGTPGPVLASIAGIVVAHGGAVSLGTIDLAPPPPVVEIPAAASSVALHRSKAKQVFGAKKPVTLTAAVTVQDGSQARGTVVFRAGKTTLGTVTVSHGKATLRLKPKLRVAKHRITAEFVPAHASVTGSSSSAVSVKVTKAKAKITGKLAKKRVKATKRARYTIKLKVAGVPKPQGKVVIRVGKKKIRTITLKAKHRGKITVKLPRLAKGKHKIKATYRGNASIKKKTTKVVTLRVR